MFCKEPDYYTDLVIDGAVITVGYEYTPADYDGPESYDVAAIQLAGGSWLAADWLDVVMRDKLDEALRQQMSDDDERHATEQAVDAWEAR